MIRTKNSLALGAVLFTASIAATTAAADAKHYTALGCQRTSAGGSISYTGWGTVSNASSTTPLTVECAGVKDASNIASGYAHVKDRHPSLGIECSLVSNYTSGNSFGGDADTAVINTNEDLWKTLNFDAVASESTGYYYLTCSIPPSSNGAQSSLAMFRINEN